MDFFTELPQDKERYDAVSVKMDKLSKRAIFISTSKSLDAPGAARLLQDKVFSKHDIPLKMIRDRYLKFRSSFWSSLAKVLQTKLNVSTSIHPQTDGQSENNFSTLSNILRHSFQRLPGDLCTMLSVLEF